MDARRFVEGYQNPAYHTVAHELQGAPREDAELATLMEGPRKWTSFFDDQLYAHLNEPKGTEADSYGLFMSLYNYQKNFLETQLENTTDAVRLHAERDIEAPSGVNELSFHTLNEALLPMWHRLFFGPEMVKLDDETLQAMQTKLAVTSAGIQEKYQAYKEATTDTTAQRLLTRLGGQLTEIDSAIVMLEVMKRESGDQPSNMVLVPAPPRFEAAHNNHDRLADFLLFDTVSDQVRGVQVKTIINGDETGYDPEYVTVIDGVTDLGNSTAAFTSRRANHQAPAPGLIALDFLTRSIAPRYKHMAADTIPSSMSDALQTAKTVFGTRNSYFNHAVAFVGERVLYDLYRQSTVTEQPAQ